MNDLESKQSCMFLHNTGKCMNNNCDMFAELCRTQYCVGNCVHMRRCIDVKSAHQSDDICYAKVVEYNGRLIMMREINGVYISNEITLSLEVE